MGSTNKCFSSLCWNIEYKEFGIVRLFELKIIIFLAGIDSEIGVFLSDI